MLKVCIEFSIALKEANTFCFVKKFDLISLFKKCLILKANIVRLKHL